MEIVSGSVTKKNVYRNNREVFGVRNAAVTKQRFNYIDRCQWKTRSFPQRRRMCFASLSHFANISFDKLCRNAKHLSIA